MNVIIFLIQKKEDGFKRKFESKLTEYSFNPDEKLNIYERLNSAEGLAKYLSAKYPGMKRFGIDGAEAFVPLVESVIQNCGSMGANNYVLVWLIEED